MEKSADFLSADFHLVKINAIEALNFHKNSIRSFCSALTATAPAIIPKRVQSSQSLEKHFFAVLYYSQQRTFKEDTT
ncbi:MAG: hypothetical protein IJZ37_01270 [Clostridia bacterium]|nr:hypothetical protein [Clostridia bacterium]